MQKEEKQDVKKQVGHLIREARKAKNLTLKELGQLVGSSESVMSRYEKGEINASLDMLARIASELGTDFTIIISGK